MRREKVQDSLTSTPIGAVREKLDKVCETFTSLGEIHWDQCLSNSGDVFAIRVGGFRGDTEEVMEAYFDVHEVTPLLDKPNKLIGLVVGRLLQENPDG